MASVLNTDLFDLYDQWNQRVAFNDGYRAQSIADANQAGRDAFHLGLDRVQGRSFYNDVQDQRHQEAREFFAAEPAAQIEDASSVEPDEIGEVTDGEETLGAESCVANETEDIAEYDVDEYAIAASHLSDSAFSNYAEHGGSIFDYTDSWQQEADIDIDLDRYRQGL